MCMRMCVCTSHIQMHGVHGLCLHDIHGVHGSCLQDKKSLKAHYKELHQLQQMVESRNSKALTVFAWVRRLALIWPGSILRAAAVGPVATQALLLAPQYLGHVLASQKVRCCISLS